MLLGVAARAVDCAGKNSTGIFAKLEDLLCFQFHRFVFVGFPIIMIGYRNMPRMEDVEERTPGGPEQEDLTFSHEIEIQK